jgi:hypothetical protein
MTNLDDEQDELARAEAAMRADDEMRARNFMPAVGGDFAFESKEAHHEYLKELATWYESFFAAKAARDVASVRYKPDEPAEVEIRFLDGSALHDEGDRLLLDGPATPEKADLMIEIVLAKGWTEARLRGNKEFKRALARACAAHGIKVLNPEMASFMADLAAKVPVESQPEPQSLSDFDQKVQDFRVLWQAADRDGSFDHPLQLLAREILAEAGDDKAVRQRVAADIAEAIINYSKPPDADDDDYAAMEM